jgi:hypothetical protein
MHWQELGPLPTILLTLILLCQIVFQSNAESMAACFL